MSERLYFYMPERNQRSRNEFWWAQVDSNHRPHAYQACALTTWAMSPFPYPLRVSGGDERDRTDDPLLAKQVLSQLSYTPIFIDIRQALLKRFLLAVFWACFVKMLVNTQSIHSAFSSQSLKSISKVTRFRRICRLSKDCLSQFLLFSFLFLRFGTEPQKLNNDLLLQTLF